MSEAGADQGSALVAGIAQLVARVAALEAREAAREARVAALEAELAEAKRATPATEGAASEDQRDWAGGLPVEVLTNVAGKLVAVETRGHGLTLMAITCKGWKDTLKEDAIDAAGGPKVWRDWSNRFGEGLPAEVLANVAKKFVTQMATDRVAELKEERHSGYWTEERIQEDAEQRKREGYPLLAFAMVSRGWRKAQLKVGGPMFTHVCSDVVVSGRVALVDWAMKEDCPCWDGDEGGDLASVAAGYGHTELVQWLIRERGFGMHEWVMENATGCGNLELVQWLRAEGSEWIEPESDQASVSAQYGHLELVQWLCTEQGFAMDEDVMRCAAGSGNLELCQWLRANGCDWNADVCARAARFGHLEILQWLRKKNKRKKRCPWSACTCGQAAEGGHLSVLRWARENGCPWTPGTREQAAAKLGYTDDFGKLVGQ